MRIAQMLFLTPLLLPLSAEQVQTRTMNEGNLILQDIPQIPTSLQEELNRYQHGRYAYIQEWSQDSKSLFIETRFGDVAQLHRIDQPGGARHQLTFFSEPIGWVSRRPGSSQFTFTMDSGGSEFAQIYSLDPQTGRHELLTDGESLNGSMRWDREGTKLAYRSTKRNGTANDLWMMNPDAPEEAKIIYEAQDGSFWSPTDWNRAGDHLLISQYANNRDSSIYQLSIETGKAQLLEGGNTQPSTNSAVGYDSDDQGFFFLTNQYGEHHQLAYRSFQSKETELLTQDLKWSIDSAHISPDRRRIAFAVNEEGYGQLYLLDTTTRKYTRVTTVPEGSIVVGISFSPDNKKLGLTINAANSATDCFTMPLGKTPLEYGPLTRWTQSETGNLDPKSYTKPELIRYKSFDNLEVPAFVYKPQGEGPFPVILSIHGGPESQFRTYFNTRFQTWIDQLGVAVIAPNIRGSRGYGKTYLDLDNGYLREDSVKDIGALLDWIEQQPELDASRVGVYGASYGGYMVLASAAHFGDRIKAAVDSVGISNFVTFLKNTQSYRRDVRRGEYGDERDPQMRAFLESISPDQHVDKMKAPMLVIQGENDPRVPVSESEQIVSALRKAGNPVWYLKALNEGHGFRKKENRDVFAQVFILFMREHLLPSSDDRDKKNSGE